MTAKIKKGLLGLLFCTLCCTGQICAQQPAEVYRNYLIARCDDGKELKGTYLKLSDHAKSIRYATNPNILCLVDKKGYTYIYDSDSCNLLTTVSPKQGSVKQVTEDCFIATKGKKTLCYNLKNEKSWELKEPLFMANRKNQIVICLSKETVGLHNSAMIGYDMRTGRQLWKTEISHKLHLPVCHVCSDTLSSTFYLIADSLIAIDPVTGEFHKHDFKAGVKELLKSRFSIAKTRIQSSDCWEEEAQWSYNGYHGISPAILTGTHSHLKERGDSLFIADAEYLYCFDKQLKAIWKTPLPDGGGAKSLLRIIGDQLLLQSYGVGFQNGLLGRCGQTFTASYDIHTGKVLQQTIVDSAKKMTGGIIVPGRAYWQNDRKLSYTDEGSATITSINWEFRDNIEPNDRCVEVCDTISILEDGYLRPIPSDSNQVVVLRKGKDASIIQTDGSETTLKADEVYLEDGNGLFSTNAEFPSRHYVVINPETRKIIVGFTPAGRTFVDKSGRLYILMKDGICVVEHDAYAFSVIASLDRAVSADLPYPLTLGTLR